jgi:pimeloyl-ACP methyl ester carboxylesterase
MSLSTFKKFGLGLGLGLPAGWFITQMAWVAARLARIDPAVTLAQHQSGAGIALVGRSRNGPVRRCGTVEEHSSVSCIRPSKRKHVTPILMQHGMFHGAWTWQWWQPLFAEWGWESVAVSLPGHGASSTQRQIEFCTLDYYLGFLKAEVDGWSSHKI